MQRKNKIDFFFIFWKRNVLYATKKWDWFYFY